MNAGHGRRRDHRSGREAAQHYRLRAAFQMGHPIAFEFANRLAKIAPAGLDRIFLRIRVRNRSIPRSRSRLPTTVPAARPRTSLSAAKGLITAWVSADVGWRDRQQSQESSAPRCCPAWIICRHTYDIEHNAFSRGLPEWGAQLADELERLIALHDASTIAAVIVEPIAGSAGVIASRRATCSACEKSATSTTFS